MYYLGIDLGSSSIKLALVEIETGKCLGVIQEPEKEMDIHAPKKGWAEQDPEDWWKYVCNGVHQIKKKFKVTKDEIKGIGIAYQMHGLVLIDDLGNPIRNSIIWCDSRAVTIGNKAYSEIGTAICDNEFLNSPGNFTASKLKWVQIHEPENYEKIYKFMLPGDYIAFKLSDTINSTITGLSEGIFWNFKQDSVSEQLLDYFQFSKELFPNLVDTFSKQSEISKKGALASGLKEGTPILYRAGDQPNNALSLNVFQPGEVAATGGTSGVVYAITNNLSVKESSRVNNFAHVNYKKNRLKNIGKLLCINGAGIQYRWLLNNLSVSSYEEMNKLANEVEIGSDGVCVIPFGNGSERMLLNQDIGTRILNLNLNRHSKSHICRAALEGIAFSFVYGIEIMKSDGIEAKVIRAGNDNLFRSKIFANSIATLIQQEIEIYNTTGAIGAARACTISLDGYEKFSSFMKNDHVMTYMPFQDMKPFKKAYQNWKKELELILNK
ncbi:MULTISPECIES: xylulokinase [Croceitalea]|uniref:FGGY family carbohydrate kinase n=1 Tax=Croceitalea vernalis TaxID=3075599 RepID=A0ABU3BF26_9FLAO|nr:MULTISPECIES: FGGY family carbohydrate kinase [unclassified Croceitalea]MDT0538975.1 FGGY family carbohydrate kinase [Croceitalea sp. P059]MDT0620763.1 FGGY family carbohydrate kinase [Croceitalea sp. P007]